MRATMWVDLRGSGFEGNEPLKTYAEQRLRSALGPLERGLGMVTVCLARPDGTGVQRTQCRMLVRAMPWADVVVQEGAPDVYAAIDRSAERLAHAVELATGRNGHAKSRPDSEPAPVRRADKPEDTTRACR
jgi:ribosome-associated translation inhibitor RaiA